MFRIFLAEGKEYFFSLLLLNDHLICVFYAVYSQCAEIEPGSQLAAIDYDLLNPGWRFTFVRLHYILSRNR